MRIYLVGGAVRDHATGIGLLKMGRDEIEDDKDTWTDGNILSRLSHQIKTWFHGNF